MVNIISTFFCGRIALVTVFLDHRPQVDVCFDHQNTDVTSEYQLQLDTMSRQYSYQFILQLSHPFVHLSIVSNGFTHLFLSEH